MKTKSIDNGVVIVARDGTAIFPAKSDEKEERKTTRLLIQHGDQPPVVLGELDVIARPPETRVNSSLSDYADREMSRKLWEAVAQLLWHASQSTDPKYAMKPFDSWSEFGFRKGDGR